MIICNRATLSWYDPPAVDGSNKKALIHDLDLLLVSPSGRRVYSNGRSNFDSLNNNERVVVPSGSEVGQWQVM